MGERIFVWVLVIVMAIESFLMVRMWKHNLQDQRAISECKDSLFETESDLHVILNEITK